MSRLLSSFPATLVCAVTNGGDPPSLRQSRMTGAAPTPPPSERQQEDNRLMSRMAEGDKTAFAEIYDRFSRPLYATALRVVNDATEAQDIVHDAFITLWEKAATFDTTRGSPFAWAVTLVRNRAIDRVRMRRRRSELLADSAPADLGYDEDPPRRGADETAAFGDEAHVVRAAVATLPLDQKRALELAFFSGLTQQQIAEQLREPLGTIKARIRRALLKLRDSLPHRL